MNDTVVRHEVITARSSRAIRQLRNLCVIMLAVFVVLSVASDSKLHSSGTGILSAQTSSGLIVIDAPEQQPWVGSFGSYFLCTTTGHGLTIKKIRYESPVQPINVDLWLRRVHTNTSGIISARGEPPNFLDPKTGSSLDMGGEFTSFRPGLRVTRPCSKSGKGSHGFTELIFAGKVGSHGGAIRKAWIDYGIDGSPHRLYSLQLRWIMVLCGDEVRGIYDKNTCGA
ncbi:hypothetical protein ABZ499_35305 [Streptomyces sp. NPDC019990]|uniref:hypothetical protein n=1 Tax=Streptomyces sp. NPDC019990 TaxID=3154693 RepID=UPI0033F90D30